MANLIDFLMSMGHPKYYPNAAYDNELDDRFKYSDFNMNSKMEAEGKRLEGAVLDNRLFEVLTSFDQYKNHDSFEPTENIGPPTFSTVEPYGGEDKGKTLASFLTLHSIYPNSQRIVDAINQINQASDISKFKNRSPLSTPYGPIYLNKNGMGLKESQNLFDYLQNKQTTNLMIIR